MTKTAHARSLSGARPALALATALLGCAAGRYALPKTASELRGYPEPEALVAYLSQKPATAATGSRPPATRRRSAA